MILNVVYTFNMEHSAVKINMISQSSNHHKAVLKEHINGHQTKNKCYGFLFFVSLAQIGRQQN